MNYIFRKVELFELSEAEKIYADGRLAIADLGIDQWQGGYPSSEIISEDIANGFLYAAEDTDTGALAAVAAVLPYESDYDRIDGGWLSSDGYNAVHRVAASADFKGKGASAYLFDNIERMAKEKGVGALRIDTHRGNTVMQRFLQKRGFTLCGMITLGHGEGDRIRLAYEKLL